MPAVIPFIPLIVGGVTGATALTAAHMQSNANRDASRMQTDAVNNAQRSQDETQRRAEQTAQEQQDYERRVAAYTQQVAANKERARAPYVALSNQAMSKMADLLGLPGGVSFGGGPSSFGAPGGGGMPPQQTQRAPALDNPMNFSGNPASSSLPAETVVIMAPTGETRRVPKALAQQYVSRGGRVMQEA